MYNHKARLEILWMSYCATKLKRKIPSCIDGGMNDSKGQITKLFSFFSDNFPDPYSKLLFLEK